MIMKITTKKELIDNIAQIWREKSMFGSITRKENTEIYNRLIREKPQNEEAIKSIIGCSELTKNLCDECGNDAETTIQIGGNAGHVDWMPSVICTDCIQLAIHKINVIV